MEVKEMPEFDPIKEFRDDHRKCRDDLLDVIEAIKAKNLPKASEILGNLNTMLGPHFRYEEETLYPALRVFLGEYIDDLLSEHDGIIETARNTFDLVNKGTISDTEAEEAAKAVQKLLIHVVNCDGLAIFTEKLSSKDLEKLSEKFIASREANVPLAEWTEKIRQEKSNS